MGVPSSLKMRTWGPPPGPAPVMISFLPSPSASPVATRTPPRNPVGYANNPPMGVPSGRKTRTGGRPPVLGPGGFCARVVLGGLAAGGEHPAAEAVGIGEEARAERLPQERHRDPLAPRHAELSGGGKREVDGGRVEHAAPELV